MRVGKRQGPAVSDLQADPLEKADLAASQPLLRAALRQSLDRWLLDMRATGGRDAEPASVDEKDREALKALGYVQ